jgi:hypothetical protein
MVENTEIRQKTTKKGKNPLLQTKILKLLYGPIFNIWDQNIFSSLNKSSDGFESTKKIK